jgi:hypothetical protein
MKYRLKEIHVQHWVQAKERRNVKLKRIITHNFDDVVKHIMEWEKLPMGSSKGLFLSSETKLFLPPKT